MGLAKSDNIIYLRIADGKLRQKTNEKDPEAVERHDDINNKYIYERVYSSCTGYLLEVRIQEHEEYGTSYSLIIFDPSDNSKFSLQMSDQSRYFPAFVQRMPNLDYSLPMTIKPFSFTQQGKQSIGLSIEQNGEKISNYYKKWNAKTEVSTQINGLEQFDFQEAKGDKDELKILRIKLIKFMKKEFEKHNKKLIAYWEDNPIPSKKEFYETASKEDTDLVEDLPKSKKSKKTKQQSKRKRIIRKR